MIQREVVGLVPMAGRATRLGPLPCSKEIYPVTLSRGAAGLWPKVASHFLLERMRQAEIVKAYLILREGKWDIPAYYGDGKELLNLNLAYLMARLPYGPPFSLDAAYPFVRDAIVALGFPDILFDPQDGYRQLLDRQAQTSADVVLGVFTIPDPLVCDPLELDDEGRVRQFFVHQRIPHLNKTWIMAVWTPVMSRFMHDYLREYLEIQEAPVAEISVGHVLHAAVNAGLVVQTVPFADGRFLDVGTPDGLDRLPAFLQ
jgi:glucose-1-phosphate thymidylyltransferase